MKRILLSLLLVLLAFTFFGCAGSSSYMVKTDHTATVGPITRQGDGLLHAAVWNGVCDSISRSITGMI